MLKATELEFVPFVKELMTFPPIPPAIALPNRSAIIFVNGSRQKSHLLKSLFHFHLKSVLTHFYFLTDTQDTPRKVSKHTDWCGPAVVAFSLTSDFGNEWAPHTNFLSQIFISSGFASYLIDLIQGSRIYCKNHFLALKIERSLNKYLIPIVW